MEEFCHWQNMNYLNFLIIKKKSLKGYNFESYKNDLLNCLNVVLTFDHVFNSIMIDYELLRSQKNI